jgi:hypothetical protein
VSILDTVKETVGLIQKIDSVDLLRQILALQNEVFALVEDNRALEARLATQANLQFKDNSYWLNGDGPFCSACRDSNAQLIRLHRQKGHLPKCPKCGTAAPRSDVDKGPVVA